MSLAVLSRDDDRIWLACGQRARLGLWTPGEKESDDEGPASGSADRSGIPGGDRSLHLTDPAGNVVELADFLRSGDGAVDGVRALVPADHSVVG